MTTNKIPEIYNVKVYGIEGVDLELFADEYSYSAGYKLTNVRLESQVVYFEIKTETDPVVADYDPYSIIQETITAVTAAAGIDEYWAEDEIELFLENISVCVDE